MLLIKKYCFLFFMLFFLMNIELIAQSEKTSIHNNSNITLNASPQPRNVAPTTAKVASDNKNKGNVVVKNKMAVSQQPSGNTSTATKVAFENKNEENVVVRKTMKARQQLSGITPSVKKVDSVKKGNNELKNK